LTESNKKKSSSVLIKSGIKNVSIRANIDNQS
jgi:hypothetical protein